MGKKALFIYNLSLYFFAANTINLAYLLKQRDELNRRPRNRHQEVRKMNFWVIL